MVFRLLSLMLALKRHESAERYSKVISLADSICLTRLMRLFYRGGLRVSWRRLGDLSIDGKDFEELKLQRCWDGPRFRWSIL